MLADRDTQAWFQKELGEHMLTRHEGTLGPCKDLGDIQEIRCLNRLIRYVRVPFKNEASDYIEWEPDPRHAEILVAALGLHQGAKAVSTPGVRRVAGANETPLGSEERELYRSNVM
eukprot:10713153-Karenia_brevis.AAC.1